MKNSKLYINLFTVGYLIILVFWFIAAQTGVFSFADLNYVIKVYHYFPYLGVWLGSILESMPEILELFISIVLIPFAVFYLLVKIFSKHVNSLWTVFFALLSVSVFESFPFRAFITGASFANFDMPLLFQYPFPGLSTLLFLLIYYFISKTKTLSSSIILMFTAICALFFYINALESMFLLGFWFLFFGSRLAKKYGVRHKSFVGTVVLQVLVVVGIVFYGLSKGELVGYATISYTQYLYHVVAYYIAPVLLMVILYLIKRIDPYEIWFKFRHIYGFMAIELGIVILSQLSIMPINPEILNSRISQFFLHLFYYVPVIYYLSRPYQNYHKGIESTPFISSIRKQLNKFYPAFEQVFAFVIALLLIIYNIYPLILQWKA